MSNLNPIQDGGRRGRHKDPLTSFSPATSGNVGVSPLKISDF